MVLQRVGPMHACWKDTKCSTKAAKTLVKYHSMTGTTQINTTKDFEIQCTKIFTDHEDPKILLAWLGESIYEGDYGMLSSSETKNIAPHPALTAVNVDLCKVSLKSMGSSRSFCFSAELSIQGHY